VSLNLVKQCVIMTSGMVHFCDLYINYLQVLFTSVCFSAILLSLVCNLLSNSVTHQQQMVQNRGFLLISHLLQKVLLYSYNIK
jgi:hypothetical protein